MYDLTGLGERLKRLRQQNRLSQESVARTLMVTPQAYSQYERGKRRPPFEILIQLKRFYNVSLDYLICGEEPIDRRLYDRLIFTEASKLPEAGKEELFHFLQFLAEKYRVQNEFPAKN